MRLLIIITTLLCTGCLSELGEENNTSNNATTVQSTNNTKNTKTNKGTQTTQTTSRDTTPPTIIETTPSQDAVDVEVSGLLVKATFSEKMDLTTLIAENIYIENVKGEEVKSKLSYNDERNEVELKPELLSLSAGYKVIASANLKDLEGNSLEATQWGFQTRAGEWHEESALELDGGSPFGAKTFLDKKGNTRVIWSQNAALWSNYYDLDKAAWAGAEKLSGNFEIQEFDATGDSEGNVLVAWFETKKLYRREFNAKTQSWGSSEVLDSTKGKYADQVTLSSIGPKQYLAVWRAGGSGEEADIFWSQSADDSWSARKRIVTVFWPWGGIRVKANKKGQAILSWNELEEQTEQAPGTYGAYFSGEDWVFTFVLAGSFGHDNSIDRNGNAMIVSTGQTTLSIQYYDITQKKFVKFSPTAIAPWGPPIVETNDAGEAFVAWNTKDGRIEVSRFDKNTWSNTEILNTPAADTSRRNPKLVIGEDGSAMIAWISNNTDHPKLNSAHFSKKNGWEVHEVRFEKSNVTKTPAFALTVDKENRFILAWDALAGSPSIKTEGFTKTKGWEEFGSPGKNGLVRNIDLQTNERGVISLVFTYLLPSSKGVDLKAAMFH